ncbi:MAG: rhodanese-like domain-containing protein [Pseudomonadota bacterium]
MRTIYCFLIILIFSSISTSLLASPPIIQPEKKFSTTQSLGFDKQISIWLVEKYVTPTLPVTIFTGSTPPPNSRVFDEADSEFSRTVNHSTYEQLVNAFKPDLDSLAYLKKTVFDIEINLWLPDELPDSLQVEKAFRALQEQWGRDKVPHACYTEFFNAIEHLYEEQKNLKGAEAINEKLVCWKDALKNHINDPSVLVAEMPIPSLLGSIRSGAKAIFIDVREPDEFAENHIPGAINLLIKDANKSSVESFKKFDVVVAYCIKDFRGFEMAKKMKSLGISQAVILNPYGIKGWIDSKLPVYQQHKINDQQAEALFHTCLTQPLNCKNQ